MIEKLKHDKKGFTMVELIVVLVILVILAALFIPALTGYIDKAREKKVLAEARMVLTAAQTVLSEQYAMLGPDSEIPDLTRIAASEPSSDAAAEVFKLAEMSGAATAGILKNDGASTSVDSKTRKILRMTYDSDDGNGACYIYDGQKGTWFFY
ncbi:MAG: prepilin-type N-terminal cleavage/methylation domain-containing protein [Lachnospiraceae bacterium]